MTSQRVEIIGADRLAATAHAAARDLDALKSANAGRIVQQRGRAGAPKRTGRLAASVKAGTDGGDVIVSSGLVYSAVIHNGWPGHNIAANPFLSRAIVNSRAEIQREYTAEAQKALGQIRGA